MEDNNGFDTFLYIASAIGLLIFMLVFWADVAERVLR